MDEDRMGMGEEAYIATDRSDILNKDWPRTELLLLSSRTRSFLKSR